jgi:tetratricopeptide (TPR) repeat protein
MKLNMAFGQSLMHTKGHVAEVELAWENVLQLAEKLNDAESQLLALYGLYVFHLNVNNLHSALTYAQKFFQVAERQREPEDLVVGERLIGFVLHYMGDQAKARHHVERALSLETGAVHEPYTARFLLDQRILARGMLGRILWLQGFPDQALQAVQCIVEDAKFDHPLTLCCALAEAACPVALFTGNLPVAQRFAAMLLDHTEKHGLTLWHIWARSFDAVLLIKHGDVSGGLQLLSAAIGELWLSKFAMRYLPFRGMLAQGLAADGQVPPALAVIDEALMQSEHNDEGWCIAELLRLRGEFALFDKTPESAIAAEERFRQALDWARRQEALSWELRAATSLARLQCDQGRIREARDLLTAVYGRFTEGFATADLKAAKRLLDDLA